MFDLLSIPKMQRYFTYWILFVLFAATCHALTYRQLLDEYTGSWSGSYEVRSESGRLVKELTAELEYWWEGDVQRSFTVFHDGDQMIYSESKFFVSRGTLFAEVQIDSAKPEVFIGKVNNKAITWIPTNVLAARDKQTIEFIRKEDGKRILHVQGFQMVPANDGEPARVNITGELVFTPKK